MVHKVRWKHTNDVLAKIAQRANQKEKMKRNRAYVVRAKSRPCIDCNVQYNPWIMQFDHRNPCEKKFEMSSLKNSYSIKKLQTEIDKCDVVCANCHLDRTYRGKHWLNTGSQAVKEESMQVELFNDTKVDSRESDVK